MFQPIVAKGITNFMGAKPPTSGTLSGIRMNRSRAFSRLRRLAIRLFHEGKFAGFLPCLVDHSRQWSVSQFQRARNERIPKTAPP